MKKNHLKIAIAAALATGALAFHAQAAPIIYTSVNNANLGTGLFNTNAVLSLAGTAANEAYGISFNGSSGTTANNFTFASGSGNFSSNFNSNYNGFGGSTGDVTLNNIVTNAIYNYQNNPSTGTLLNLTIGNTYDVLILNTDTRGGSNGRTFYVGSTGGSDSATQVYANSGANAGGYVLGEFTADATSQAFTINNTGGYEPQINAILLENVPEPSTYALMVAGLLALVATRRLRALCS